MADDPKPPSDVKFDPNSKELLSAGMKATEQTLDETARRPFEMLEEAEATVSRFPPIPAIVSIALGGFLVLCAVPYAISWNGNLWKGWNETVAQAKSSDEIRGMEKGRNFMPTAVIAPFALVAVGLGIYSRRHRLGTIGLWVSAFALVETIGAAGIYEWRDDTKREAFAQAQDVKLAEEAERLRQQQVEGQAKREEALKKAEEARLLAAAELERKKAEDEEATRDRARAAVDAALQAQQERQRQENEKRESEKQRLAEATENKRQEEFEQQLAELDKTRTVNERKLAQLQQKMNSLVALRDKQAASIKDVEASIAGCRETMEKNVAQLKPLAEQQEDLNSTIRASDLTLDRIQDQRAELRKQSKAANFKDAMARLAESESNAKERKGAAVKDLRELETQRKSLQKQSDVAAASLKRAQGFLDKLTAGSTDLEDQIAALQPELDETQKTIADLKTKAEKLKADFAQDKEKH